MHHHWQHSYISSMGWRGRWCRSLWRHSGHLIVHHHWEHSQLLRRRYSRRWRLYSLTHQLPSAFQPSFIWGWRCLCPFWHNDLVIVHHQWEHSSLGRQCLCRGYSLNRQLTIEFQSSYQWGVCRRLGWHSDHLIVHDQWEHSKRGWPWRWCLCLGLGHSVNR